MIFKYFRKGGIIMEDKWTTEAMEKNKKHPCYCDTAQEYARMHIPVAPRCNIQCNYCNRKYDCLNESRPGVTSEVLKPQEALEKYKLVKSKLRNLMVVGIAGPGDALANFEETKKSIEFIKAYDSDVTFCLSTNGLMLPDYVDEIYKIGVTHVTVTVNAIDSKIAAKIYSTVYYKDKIYTGEEAGALLIERQLRGLEMLQKKGMICKVNTVMIKEVNDNHIEEVVKKVKNYGVYINNIMPLIPATGSKFETMEMVSNKELNDLREKCSVNLKQMYHCRQCRADAIGILGEDISLNFREDTCNYASNKNDVQEGYTIAVASKSGRLIDQHFGHVKEFFIYKYSLGRIKFIEKRSVNQYCLGVENCDDSEAKLQTMLKVLENCNLLLCLRIGNIPRKNLESHNIHIIELYEEIEKGILKAVRELKKAS